MKIVFVCFLFVSTLVLSQACKEDGDNTCRSNNDCCSRVCEKKGYYRNGICKPEPALEVQCKADLTSNCANDQDCCSGSCKTRPSYGKRRTYCEPRGSTEDERCLSDSDDCENNEECCSGLCKKKSAYSQHGKCQKKPENAYEVKKPEHHHHHHHHHHHNHNHKKLVHTSSYVTSELPDFEEDSDEAGDEDVEEEDTEEETDDDDVPVSENECQDCEDDSSEIDDAEEDNSDCHEDWFNGCTGNEQCCSKFCDKDPDWEYGICKQYDNSSTASRNCLKLYDIGCEDNCCGNLKCSHGPYNNWKYGMCVMPTKPSPPPKRNTTDDTEDDNEDSFTYYKNFVQDKLLIKNDETFDSEPLQCRDIDTKGQFFYKYNQTHSFRICDVCKEFPFEKLQDVRISHSPKRIIQKVSFQECFISCIGQHNCVAISFDEDEKTCHMFDGVEGDYDDDEYGWTTVILTQPIFVLRDYVLSRHTQTICDSRPDYEYQTDDILDCFRHCESNRCSVSTYHDGKCMVYLQGKNCKNVYYKFGHLSLFYRDYFHDDYEWRFTEIDKGGEEYEELVDIYNEAELSANKEKGSRLTPQNTKLTLYEVKKSRKEKFLNDCFKDCVKADICTGVLVNFEQYICQIMDWDGVKSRNYQDKGFREFKLVHKKRDKVLYGFDENNHFKLDRIPYNEQLTTQNLQDCVLQCTNTNHCLDVYFNLIDKACLIVGEYPKKIQSIDPEQWINFKNNRIDFNHPRFRFTIIGKNQYLSRNFDKYLIDTFYLNERPAESKSSYDRCFEICNEQSDGCQFIQISRSEKSMECKIYKDITGDEDWDYETQANSDLFARVMVPNFDSEYLNKLKVFNGYDAMSCKPDKESIASEAQYLYRAHDLKKIQRLRRYRRDFWDDVGGFFEDVGNSIIETPKKIIETGVSVVQSIDKVAQGDLDGALETFREAPLVKSAEDLVDNVKTVGEGIIEGDLSKIGEGALGVITNDLTDFIPGGGKILKLGGKAAKGLKNTIKKGLDKVEDRVKRDTRRGKRAISKKNNRKSDQKRRKDQQDFENRCRRQNQRNKRQAKRKKGQTKQKQKDCDKGDKCPAPSEPKGYRGKVLPKTVSRCKGSRPNEKCNYLCNAGYTEEPYALTCLSTKKWDKTIGCKAQECGSGRMRTIFVKSASSLFKIGKANDALLYAVRFDSIEKSPLWSITYHKWQILSMKPETRAGHFVQHPCPNLKGKQQTDNHYVKKTKKVWVNRKGYHKGHLSPADMFRWNEKSSNSGNLYLNIAPQNAKLNVGSWKTLELALACASKSHIKAIVVTGHGGKVVDTIGLPKNKIKVKEYFWKLVCYTYQGNTHVAGFMGKNKHARTESKASKKFTLTPRDQSAILAIDKELSKAGNNPWLTALRMVDIDEFALINRYPVPTACEAAKTLNAQQKRQWMSQFSVFAKAGKRKKRQAETGAFCSQSAFEEFSKWMATFSTSEEEENAENDEEAEDEEDGGDDDDDDEDDDDGQIKNILAKNCGKKIVGYYASWGKNIVKKTLSRFTHIIYAFFEVKANGQVALGNPDHASSKKHDEVRRIAEKRLNRLLDIKSKLPDLKVMFAVGGWENSQYFSKIAASPSMKVTFIASVLKVLEDNNLDGIDIDWEYPVAGGANPGIPQDKQNYVKLMSDLRTALDEQSKKLGRSKYLLTFAGAAGETALRVGYDLPGLLKYADWVNVMSYDFFGPWETKWGAYAGPPSPLYHNAPKGYSGKYNVNWAIKTYVCKLNSPKQVVMGIPVYGRYWHNVEAKSGEYGIYRMAKLVNGKAEGGYVSWKDIKKEWLKNPNFQHYFDKKVKSPYAYSQNGTYLGYENPESVKEKIKFALEKNLGGLMVWEVGQDDEDNTMIDLISAAQLCTNKNDVNFKCIPIDERRWWTFEENEKLAGLCGKSAPLYKGYYPHCDPDDLGYSCCGEFGYCGSGPESCDCPTCVDYAKNPEKLIQEPIKPKTGKILWHLSNAPDGSRGRCGKEVPKVEDSYAICNPDDQNAHCCSNGGYCGNTEEHCNCADCVDFKKNPNHRF